MKGVDVIDACGLRILAKEDIYQKNVDLPPHDLIIRKNARQRRLWEGRVKGRKHRFNQILEVGIAAGGSLPYLFDLCDADFIAGVDILPETSKIPNLYNRSKLRGNFALYFETDQTDRNALQSIVSTHFQDGLDLIVDDGSHLLDHTRDTFEILFPHLKRGGLYVIEDYGWSQNQGFAYLAEDRYRNQPTTTQLVLELTMLMCTHPNWITRVVADCNTITVEKGPAPVTKAFSIKDSSFNWAPVELSALVQPEN